MQEMVRELQSELRVYKDGEQVAPTALTRALEQKIKRLEAELEVSEDQRRHASQELVRLQSQFSEVQHLNEGHKEELVQEVRELSVRASRASPWADLWMTRVRPHSLRPPASCLNFAAARTSECASEGGREGASERAPEHSPETPEIVPCYVCTNWTNFSPE